MQWNQKKVLVTGADGFIGSHLVEHLVALGATVTAFGCYNSFNNWGNLEDLPQQTKASIQFIMGDIRDAQCVRQAVKGMDIVFHLAALIAIPYSYRCPASYVDTNINGTLNVLQSCQEFEIERLLHTSTSEVYGTAQYVPIDEAHPYQGQSPYAASKIGADMMAESFYRSFGTQVSIVRPFNTYGPRQSARAIIPTIITQILAGKPQIQLGSLTPTRDLNFVKDTVAGFVAIAESPKTVGTVTNIGTGIEIAMGDLAKKIIALMGSNAVITTTEERLRPEKSEVFRLLASNEKIKGTTRWQPTYSLDAGLKETIQWIEAHQQQYKATQYTI